jgi:hypothetical protein
MQRGCLKRNSRRAPPGRYLGDHEKMTRARSPSVYQRICRCLWMSDEATLPQSDKGRVADSTSGIALDVPEPGFLDDDGTSLAS